MKKILFFTIATILFCAWLSCKKGLPKSNQIDNSSNTKLTRNFSITPGMRGWAKGNGKTLTTAEGNLIRACKIGLRYDTTAFDSTFATIKTMGYNAIHVYAGPPDTLLTGPSQYKMIDAVVHKTAAAGLYLILTIGGSADSEYGAKYYPYIYNFWQYYAPRYMNYTHMIYEIKNEPIHYATTARDPYCNREPTIKHNFYLMEAKIYNLIRSYTANVPVILCSYIAINSLSTNPYCRLHDADSIAYLAAHEHPPLNHTINWAKTAIGFHCYNAYGCNTLNDTKKAIINFQTNNIPVFATEYHSVRNTEDPTASCYNTRTSQFFGFLKQYESLGVSWCNFDASLQQANGSLSWYVNAQGHAVPDSVKKYKDSTVNAINNGGVTAWTPDFGTWPAVH